MVVIRDLREERKVASRVDSVDAAGCSDDDQVAAPHAGAIDVQAPAHQARVRNSVSLQDDPGVLERRSIRRDLDDDS